MQPVGLDEGRKEFKISDEYNDGGDYGRLINVVRTFSWMARLPADTQFVSLTDIFDVIGTVTPIAWLLLENDDDYRWLVLAKFASEVKGTHKKLARTSTSISLVEVV
jgi:hypothetical protein